MGGGTGRLVSILLSLTILLLPFTVSVLAYESGDTVNYTTQTVADASVFSVNGNDGCCAECGKPMGGAGTGTIQSQLSNNSLTAKVVYYTAIQKNWTRNGNSGGSTTNGASYSIFAERMVQVSYQGASAVWAECPEVSSVFKQKVEDAVDGCRNITVPSNLKVFYVKTSSSTQNFIFWEYVEDGHVTLVKTPETVSRNNPSATLAGAVYYVYTNQACTTRAKDTDGNAITLTTNASGKTSVVTVAPGTYYAKEITASTGYLLDPTVRSVTVTESNTESSPATFRSVEPLPKGYVACKKNSGNSSITG